MKMFNRKFGNLLIVGGLIVALGMLGCGDSKEKKDENKKNAVNKSQGDGHDEEGKGHDDDQKPGHDNDSQADKTANTSGEPASKNDRWSMWGGTPSRNMISSYRGDWNLDFDLEEEKNVKWIAKLGSQTYGNPVVSNGKIIVGTNNGALYRPKHSPVKEGERILDDGDRGCLICFNEDDGKFLWQLTRRKLEIGRVQDWMLQGICSVPCIEGDRLWVVTNRCELMCLDMDGFYDDENDGEIKNEEDDEKQDADIVWSLDMINELGVFPHNLATSSPVIVGDNVYLLTSNGVDEAHIELPSPRAPSFLCVNKKTGKVVWEKRYPKKGILHGQWSSPAVGVVNGKTQVYFPGGDGVLYALNPDDGEILWQFDLNPKDTVWELGGVGSRNAVISTPVFYENSVILGVGQDPEHGEGVGHLWRIDATKTGDVSAELGEINKKGKPNPNSAVIWHYGGIDEDGEITGEKGVEVFHRTMSTASICDGMVFLADLSGRMHCIDFKTGKRLWYHDLYSEVWGSTMAVNGHVLLGNGEGTLTMYPIQREVPFEPERTRDGPRQFDKKAAKTMLRTYTTQDFSSIYSTPTIANGMMYLSDRSRLYAIELEKKD